MYKDKLIIKWKLAYLTESLKYIENWNKHLTSMILDIIRNYKTNPKTILYAHRFRIECQ